MTMTTTRKMAILLCALLAAALVSGCKTEEQMALDTQQPPTVVSPEVNITQEAKDDPETITVSGSGEVTLAPDTASVSIVIRTDDAEAAAAQTANAELTEAVLASLRANGVQDADVRTEGVNLNEVYDYEKSPAELVGYTMRSTLQVTVRDIEAVGAVITDAIAAGATSTHGLSFTVSDSSGAYQDALRAAVADAAGKAEAMADAMGLELNPIPLSVSEASHSYRPYAYDDMAVAESAEMEPAANSSAISIPVSTGELSVTAQVSIVYTIASAAAAE